MIAGLHRWALLLFAWLVVAGNAYEAAPPAPERWVTDTAGVLSAVERDDLDARLQAYEQQTGHQVIVWVGRTAGEGSVEDFAVRAFEAWKVGRAGEDDGVALFVLVDDRKVRIEVGYGLEDRVTDLAAARIIRDAIVPRIVDGDFDGAIRGGTEGIVDTIEGREGALPLGTTTARAPDDGEGVGVGSTIATALLGLVILILFIRRPSLGLFVLGSMLGRGGGGGRRGGGGGFSGGGGRSGGGGATGGW